MKLLEGIESVLSKIDSYLTRHTVKQKEHETQYSAKDMLVVDLMVKAMKDFYASERLSLEGRVPGDHPTIPQADLNARLNAEDKVRRQYPSMIQTGYDPFRYG